MAGSHCRIRETPTWKALIAQAMPPLSGPFLITEWCIRPVETDCASIPNTWNSGPARAEGVNQKGQNQKGQTRLEPKGSDSIENSSQSSPAVSETQHCFGYGPGGGGQSLEFELSQMLLVECIKACLFFTVHGCNLFTVTVIDTAT